LESIAYAEHWQTIIRHPFYLLHYGAMGSNYSRAKPIPKRKASWDYHCIITVNAVLSVPNKIGLNAYYIVKNTVNIAVTIAARKNGYPDSCCHYFVIKTCNRFY
jgi:hypothetical protein